MAKATTPRPIPFSFPDDADFAEALLARPDLVSLLEEESTHHMPPALHDVPFGLMMAPVPRRIDRTTRVGAAAGLLEPAPSRIDHTTTTACWTPSAASHDELRPMSTATRSRDALWTMGAAAQDGISWATWHMQRAPQASTVPLGAPEGSLVDAVEACLALPLDGAFIRDFCRQD